MKIKNLQFASCAIGCLAFLAANGLAQQSGEIERLDPAVDAIVPSGAHVEKLADGLGFVEGPKTAKGLGITMPLPHAGI